MSIFIMAQVWKIDLTPTEKLVLLAIADCANDEGKAWPAASTLMRKTSLSESSVRRAVGVLVEKGLMQQFQRPGTSPVYMVNPCHSDTPVTVTPLSERHPTPVTVTPKPSRTINTSTAKAVSVARAKPKIDIAASGLKSADAIGWAVKEMGWGHSAALGEWLRFHDDAIGKDRRYVDWMATWRNWCRSPYCKTEGAGKAKAAEAVFKDLVLR